MHSKVWNTAGHVKNFTDPLVECKVCHHRYRADNIINDTCSNCGSKSNFTDEKDLIYYSILMVLVIKFILDLKQLKVYLLIIQRY